MGQANLLFYLGCQANAWPCSRDVADSIVLGYLGWQIFGKIFLSLSHLKLVKIARAINFLLGVTLLVFLAAWSSSGYPQNASARSIITFDAFIPLSSG